MPKWYILGWPILLPSQSYLRQASACPESGIFDTQSEDFNQWGLGSWGRNVILFVAHIEKFKKYFISASEIRSCLWQ